MDSDFINDQNEPCCRACQFFHPRERFSDGWCRRFPPQAAKDFGVYPSGPLVQSNDWCGEFQPTMGQISSEEWTTMNYTVAEQTWAIPCAECGEPLEQGQPIIEQARRISHKNNEVRYIHMHHRVQD